MNKFASGVYVAEHLLTLALNEGFRFGKQVGKIFGAFLKIVCKRTDFSFGVGSHGFQNARLSFKHGTHVFHAITFSFEDGGNFGDGGESCV